MDVFTLWTLKLDVPAVSPGVEGLGIPCKINYLHSILEMRHLGSSDSLGQQQMWEE